MNTEPNKTEKKTGKIGVFLAEMPRKLPSFILKNWSWKLMSVLMAVCLWAFLIMQDPTLTRERVFTDVTLNVVNADTLRRNSGLVVLSGLDEENLKARMRVDVPQRVYNNVTVSNFNPRIDLSRITDVGEQEIRVTSTSTTTYGSVQDISPDTITVVVDEYVTNYRVPVSVNVTGEYPDGFHGSSISADPSVVAVSGPRSIVDQIARVVVDYDVSRLSAREGTVLTARVMRYVDQDGNDVDNSLLEATSANVVLRTVILTQTLYPIREFPLDMESMVEGTPAKGYQIKSVSVSPSVFSAAGTSEALDSIDALFAASPVNVNGKDSTFTQTVRIRKPSELAYVSNEAVNVTVEIAPVIVSSTYSSAKLSVRGIDSGLKASLDKKNVTMAISGPKLLLDGLRTGDVTAYVDATGLEAGEHELPVQLHIEDADLTDVTWTATPTTVTVKLTETDS